MYFSDRQEAGEQLAARLESYRDQNPLILAVPRGGVPVARPIWEKIGGDLDLIITRKIGAPNQPELAVGAVAGDGFVMLNDRVLSRVRASKDYIDEAVKKEVAEIKRRLEIYRGEREEPAAGNRLVILVDDGVATGYTLLAALRSLRAKKPSKLILAVPVGPPETLDMFESEVDRLIYLEAPANFAAVGQFYNRFDQVSDSEVISTLREAWRKREES
jgi:putative phosphoribosyl transferase